MSPDLHHEELTIQAAADLLNLSRPYVVWLLDEGRIPSHCIGDDRRVLTKDAMAYKAHSNIERRAALDELAHLGQVLGVGYE